MTKRLTNGGDADLEVSPIRKVADTERDMEESHGEMKIK